MLLRAQAIDTLTYEGDLRFNFRIDFGPRHNWIVSKAYEEFEAFHRELQETYGFEVPPALPPRPQLQKKEKKRSGLFRRSHKIDGNQPSDESLTDGTTGGRGTVSAAEAATNLLLQHLEEFLLDVMASSHQWTPQSYNIRVPNPLGRGKPGVPVVRALFDFLEFEQYLLVPNVEDDADSSGGGATTHRSDGGGGGSSSPLLPLTAQSSDAATFDSTPPLKAQISATLLPSSSSRGADVAVSSRHHMDSGQLALAAAASSITSHIRTKIKNFTIYQDDRIDYHVQVSLCGHTWVVSKRYSEFKEFHENLVKLYGKDVVPSFRQGDAAAWSKLSQKTGQKRQAFFTRYLQDVVSEIDRWAPRGLLTSFEIERESDTDMLRTRVTVSVNQFLFEFLSFEGQITNLCGEDAAAALGQQQSVLPEEAVKALEKKNRVDRRAAMTSAIERQRKTLRHTSEDTMKDIEAALALLRDDRDIIRFFEHFLVTGYVVNDASQLDSIVPTFAEILGPTTVTTTPPHTPRLSPRSPVPSAGASPSRDTHHSHHLLTSPVKLFQRKIVIDKGACTESIVMGVTSAQLLRLISPIAFNDTRIAVIRLFTPALVDIDELQAVFDILWYDWEAARYDVEQLLLAE